MWTLFPVALLALAVQPAAPRCAVGPFGETLEPQVDAMLSSLSESDLPLGHRARVVPMSSGEVRVLLLDGNGVQVAERTLPTDGSCEGLARAVAVVISSWTAELRSGELAAPDLPQQEEREVPPRPPLPLRWRAEAGLMGVVSDGDSALGGTGRFSLPLGSILAQFSAGGTTNRSMAVRAGDVSWRRSWGGLGLAYPFWRTRDIEVQLGGAALGGLIQLKGSGFDTDRPSRGWDLGAMAGLTASLPGHWLKPWIGAHGTRWFRENRLMVEGVGNQPLVPQTELWLTAGVALGPP